jgi:hypothetical protein
MGQMTDSTNPANIPAALDGRPALRITVLANPAGEAMDSESGNAGVDAVANSCAVRFARQLWTVGYTNESGCAGLTQALANKGLHWTSAPAWPAPGVYLWAADPLKTGWYAGSLPGIVPLAVQDQWLNVIDVSETAPNFPAEVAGYIDGASSAWPASAWDRFTVITPLPPNPPAYPYGGKPMMYRRKSDGATWCIDGAYRFPVITGAMLAAGMAAGVPVWECSDAEYEAVSTALAQ